MEMDVTPISILLLPDTRFFVTGRADVTVAVDTLHESHIRDNRHVAHQADSRSSD